MSERNKDKLSRADWVKQTGDASSQSHPEDKLPMDEWEKRALRGRSLLSGEEEAKELLEDLDAAIENQYGSAPLEDLPEKRNNFRTWMGIAAGLLLLLLAAWWLWPGKASPEQLYAQHFVHLDNDLSVNLMGENQSDPLTEVLRPYNARRYGEAAQTIAQYLQNQKDTLPLHLYYGISLMESGQPQAAVDQFKLVITAQSTDNYQAMAEWYVCLAYLKLGQLDEARARLRTIARPGHHYYQQAAALFEEL